MARCTTCYNGRRVTDPKTLQGTNRGGNYGPSHAEPDSLERQTPYKTTLFPW